MPVATDGKRALRVATTRSRIIDVALDLYVQQGFAATTIDDIMVAAGVGRTTFFRYFDGKEAVIFEPMRAIEAWMLEELRSRPAGEPPTMSVVAVCLHSEWPPLNRRDLRRVRKILTKDSAVGEAVNVHRVSSFSPHLIECLSEMAPEVSALDISVVAATTMAWTKHALTSHVIDGRPLGEHFAEVIGATAALAQELVSILGSGQTGTA